MNDPLNRRGFLKLGGGALALTALASDNVRAEDKSVTSTNAPVVIPGPGPHKRTLKRAIMWATVPGEMSVMDKFKMIKDAGFDGVEPSCALDQAEVLKARDATGLFIPSVFGSVQWVKPLSDPNPATREISLEDLKTSLRNCKAYGGSSVLLVPGVVNKNVSYDEAYQRSQAEIRKAIPLAQELGVKIAVENVWNYFLLSPLEACRFVDELNASTDGPPAVGWHFDIGNIIYNGWPEQWIRILGKRIQKMHFKEYSRVKRDKEGLERGFKVDYLEGDDNWPVVMQAIDDIGYDGWAIAEPPWYPKTMTPAQFVNHVRERLDIILTL